VTLSQAIQVEAAIEEATQVVLAALAEEGEVGGQESSA